MQQWVKRRNDAMQWLIHTFPKAFKLTERKPLEKDILAQITKLGLSNQPDLKDLEKALHYYMHWGSYYEALREGKPRINLRGQQVGIVSKEEAEEAKRCLALALEGL